MRRTLSFFTSLRAGLTPADVDTAMRVEEVELPPVGPNDPEEAEAAEPEVKTR